MEREEELIQEALALQDVGAALGSVADELGQARIIKYMIDFYDLDSYLYDEASQQF